MVKKKTYLERCLTRLVSYRCVNVIQAVKLRRLVWVYAVQMQEYAYTSTVAFKFVAPWEIVSLGITANCKGPDQLPKPYNLSYTSTIFYSQLYCKRTAKALIRLRECAVWSGPSLSAYTTKVHFHMSPLKTYSWRKHKTRACQLSKIKNQSYLCLH